jgi:hypothetical protein
VTVLEHERQKRTEVRTKGRENNRETVKIPASVCNQKLTGRWRQGQSIYPRGP